MFILPGLVALVIFIYARPFEFFPTLRELPLLYLFFGLAVFGLVVDMRQRAHKIAMPPQGRLIIAFCMWCVFTAGIKDFAAVSNAGLGFAIPFSIYFVIALGLTSFKTFEVVAATILVCSLWVSAVCVHQGMQSLQCVTVPAGEDKMSSGHPDGRPCEDVKSCLIDAPDPDADYLCERVGVFDTTSIGGGRVRYVGVLQDPNEAAMAVAIGVPLAFAFSQRRRTVFRFLVAATAFLLASIMVVMSQSRGAQLVFLAVLAVYFLKRYRWKGLVFAAVAALPVLAMGGREGSEAESSSLERLENLQVGLQLFKDSPVFGVGCGRFTEYHNLTAHNSYVLAAAELGGPGLVAWLTILFGSFKTAFRAMTSATDPKGEVARIWGLAFLASFAGLSVGIFFLSFNYHYVFWIYTGMVEALAGAVTRRLPNFHVVVTPKEVGLLTLGGVLLLLVVYLQVKFRLGSA